MEAEHPLWGGYAGEDAVAPQHLDGRELLLMARRTQKPTDRRLDRLEEAGAKENPPARHKVNLTGGSFISLRTMRLDRSQPLRVLNNEHRCLPKSQSAY
ncbi:hypothetical protein EC9_10030 [Rosistilla ulvae]|uniref:Uncharacterized protein n=1 Tax=Rosistilla ulvae TaxID=1930277 RepID=A0A517LW28_9BACT|nr:hypothetical protein EC9_10030 [Rosistilla ulvae]